MRKQLFLMTPKNIVNLLIFSTLTFARDCRMKNRWKLKRVPTRPTKMCLEVCEAADA